MNSIKFNNDKVQKLYDISHSDTVANLKNPTDIKNILLSLINDIIFDTDAYLEARKWKNFNAVIQHIENDNNIFNRMDFDTSICFSLWMYIYH